MITINPNLLNQLLDRYALGRISATNVAFQLINSCVVQCKVILLDVLVDILPSALTVAGSILVVNLGWRLFRNFTKG